jgi:hypothetical protein
MEAVRSVIINDSLESSSYPSDFGNYDSDLAKPTVKAR